MIENDATADYTRVAAWRVGPDDAPDTECITVAALIADLIDTDGAERLPSVEFRIPETPGGDSTVVRVPADYAEAFGRYLILAADAAREATT